jgi:hypothetical protein
LHLPPGEGISEFVEAHETTVIHNLADLIDDFLDYTPFKIFKKKIREEVIRLESLKVRRGNRPGGINPYLSALRSAEADDGGMTPPRLEAADPEP